MSALRARNADIGPDTEEVPDVRVTKHAIAGAVAGGGVGALFVALGEAAGQDGYEARASLIGTMLVGAVIGTLIMTFVAFVRRPSTMRREVD